MNDIGLKNLATMIYDRCGIDYLKNLKSLNTKISQRLKELGISTWEYCGYLRVEKDEWDKLIELITINETYFFREENLLKEFKETILPQYGGRTKDNPLRIWCAASSTGEEPYTLSMLIEESKLFGHGAVEIIASDINKKVVKKAESGCYSKKSFSFRKTPSEMLNKYFIHKDEEYEVIPVVRNRVKFKNLNMLDPKIEEEVGRVDIIFCRNVLIYFDVDTIKNLSQSFYNLLKDKGYLFLGHAETISGMNSGFNAIYTDSTFYYRKEEEL